MLGEGVLYCLQSRLWGRAGGAGGAEGSINAGGCNFNSFPPSSARNLGPRLRWREDGEKAGSTESPALTLTQLSPSRRMGLRFLAAPGGLRRKLTRDQTGGNGPPWEPGRGS